MIIILLLFFYINIARVLSPQSFLTKETGKVYHQQGLEESLFIERMLRIADFIQKKDKTQEDIDAFQKEIKEKELNLSKDDKVQEQDEVKSRQDEYKIKRELSSIIERLSHSHISSRELKSLIELLLLKKFENRQQEDEKYRKEVKMKIQKYREIREKEKKIKGHEWGREGKIEEKSEVSKDPLSEVQEENVKIKVGRSVSFSLDVELREEIKKGMWKEQSEEIRKRWLIRGGSTKSENLKNYSFLDKKSKRGEMSYEVSPAGSLSWGKTSHEVSPSESFNWGKMSQESLSSFICEDKMSQRESWGGSFYSLKSYDQSVTKKARPLSYHNSLMEEFAVRPMQGREKVISDPSLPETLSWRKFENKLNPALRKYGRNVGVVHYIQLHQELNRKMKTFETKIKMKTSKQRKEKNEKDLNEISQIEEGFDRSLLVEKFILEDFDQFIAMLMTSKGLILNLDELILNRIGVEKDEMQILLNLMDKKRIFFETSSLNVWKKIKEKSKLKKLNKKELKTIEFFKSLKKKSQNLNKLSPIVIHSKESFKGKSSRGDEFMQEEGLLYISSWSSFIEKQIAPFLTNKRAVAFIELPRGLKKVSKEQLGGFFSKNNIRGHKKGRCLFPVWWFERIKGGDSLSYGEKVWCLLEYAGKVRGGKLIARNLEIMRSA